MTVNEKIIQALQPFDIPVVTDFFGGKQKEYFTFNYAADHAVLFGDNAPMEVLADVQIHYFLPMRKDYLEIKKAIRRALLEAGFTFPAVTSLVEPDGEIRHLIFECEIENEYEMED